MTPAKKPRKALNDTLAAEFVYGATEGKDDKPAPTPVEVEEAIDEQLAKTTEKQSRGNLMSRLMEAPEKEATVRVTVDLPKSMHQKLSMLCARTGRKKVEIIRMLLDEALDEVNE
jgi:macrodomain Ter protein organizer (MatP/YcbG family)